MAALTHNDMALTNDDTATGQPLPPTILEGGLAEQILSVCMRHEELLIQLLAHHNGNAKQGSANCPQMKSETPTRDATTSQHAEIQVIGAPRHTLSQDEEEIIGAIQDQAEANPMNGRALNKRAREVEEDQQRHEQAHSWIARLVTSRFFERFFFTLIVSYSIFMGIDAEVSIQAAFHDLEGTPTSKTWVIIDILFFIAFCIEALLRMAYWGRRFLTGRDGWWNTIEVLLLVLGALDYGVATMDFENFQIFRVLKLTNKLLKLMRLVNYLRFFEAFRAIIVGVTSSLKYFMWSMFAMMCILYLFSVCLVWGVAAGLQTGARQKVDEAIAKSAQDHWGSISKAALTLYKALTGGGAWGTPGEALYEISPFHFALLVMFVSFMKFSVMNVLVGLFVAKSKSALDQDEKAIAELNLRRLFRSLDADHSGDVSAKELLHSLTDEEVKKGLHRLNISPLQVVKTILMTDVSDDGNLRINEFVGGFNKANGPAKGLDVQLLLKRLEGVTLKLGIQDQHTQHLRTHKHDSLFHQ